MGVDDKSGDSVIRDLFGEKEAKRAKKLNTSRNLSVASDGKKDTYFNRITR